MTVPKGPISVLCVVASDGEIIPLSVDANGYLQVAVEEIEAVDASAVTFTPAVLTDWDSDADPGQCNDALDQLAERVDDLEADPGHEDIGARVYHDAAQSIADSTAETLAFNSERWDTDTIHDTATNNSRLTCKTAGKYIISAHVEFEQDGTGTRRVRLLLNATDIIASLRIRAVAGGTTRMSISTIYDLAVNDYLQVIVYQDSGGALDLESSAKHSPEFAMQMLVAT